ncbi:family 16 glycoside hydrolase [Alistipes ihumii]|uniref:family 16 glycoside hydrolase n=1 Tax=Alistipes ihumii TaxID=1470347 RepID=UPI003AF69BDA
MRKIVLILACVAMAVQAMGQAAPNRTWKTKVSDALGLMPAPDPAEYNRLMGDLLSTGSQGVDMLVSMFDGTNNVPVAYALSGWAAFVSSGHEADRKVFAEGIVRGLDGSADPEIAAFYIRLLQQAGGDESVDALTARVSDKRLGSPALVALASIGTPKAKQAIAGAVKTGEGDRVALAHAVGDAAVASPEIEQVLLSWLGSDDTLDKEAYYALSKIGTSASLPALRAAAEKAQYTGEPTNATEAYSQLIAKLYADGRSKEAGAEANRLLKKATAAGAEQSRIAAARILASQPGKTTTAFVVKAMKDTNRAYRNAVLDATRPYADAALYEALIPVLTKSKDAAAQTDLIAYFGCQKAAQALPAVLDRFNDADAELSAAAMWAATRIGGMEVPAALAAVLGGEDAARIAVAEACLASYKGNIDAVVAPVAENGSVQGRVAALELLGRRGATSRADVVLKAAGDLNPTVAKAASDALAGVVTDKDLPALYSLLESMSSASDANAAAVQHAVAVAMKNMPVSDKAAAIASRMKANEAKKSLYYSVLAEAGVPEAVDIISEGFSDGTPSQKDDAFRALLNVQGMAAADRLLGIASGSEARYAVDALGRYIELAAQSGATAENKVLMLSGALDVLASNPAIGPEMAARLRAIVLGKVEQNKTFQGLILAGRYLDDPDGAVRQAAAMAVQNTALAHTEYYGPVVENLLKKACDADQSADSGYHREAVNKHLASLPKNGGYVSMFNGKDLSGWKGLVEDPIARAKMKPAELAKKQAVADEAMHRDWKVDNGMLVYVGQGFDNICTEKLYRDFEMYVDWKLDAEGQEGDAGIYLRGTPQVQIWDTSRRNVGAEVGSGGLYNNTENPSKPTSVADNKLGDWNTFYIKMVGDRVTVVLNGQKVVDNVMLENFWDRSQPIFPIEQIELQAHGTKVYFRNLYINELPQIEPTKLSAEEQKEGFRLLYDGTNMHGWIGNTRDYVSENGAIALYPGNGGGGNLYTKEEFGDFVLRFEFQLTEGANNGIGIRTPLEGDAAYVGMEIQVLDNEAPIYSQLEKYQYHGSVYGVIAAKRGFLKPVGEWNTQEIWIKGDDIRVTLNGTVITEGNIAEASKNGTLDHRDHPGLQNKKGHIGFLGHGSEVRFRNIRIKELK